jgi:hypothetical protein
MSRHAENADSHLLNVRTQSANSTCFTVCRIVFSFLNRFLSFNNLPHTERDALAAEVDRLRDTVAVSENCLQTSYADISVASTTERDRIVAMLREPSADLLDVVWVATLGLGGKNGARIVCRAIADYIAASVSPPIIGFDYTGYYPIWRAFYRWQKQHANDRDVTRLFLRSDVVLRSLARTLREELAPQGKI